MSKSHDEREALEIDEIACRYATMGSEGAWIFREGALHEFVGEIAALHSAESSGEPESSAEPEPNTAESPLANRRERKCWSAGWQEGFAAGVARASPTLPAPSEPIREALVETTKALVQLEHALLHDFDLPAPRQAGIDAAAKGFAALASTRPSKQHSGHETERPSEAVQRPADGDRDNRKLEEIRGWLTEWDYTHDIERLWDEADAAGWPELSSAASGNDPERST